MALSFSLSIAISTLVGFGLNYTPFGIRLAPILLSLSTLIVALSVGGLYRRERASTLHMPIDLSRMTKDYFQLFRAEKGADRLLTTILVMSIISPVVVLVNVIVVSREGESLTEFYVLEPGGMAEGYPRNLTVGQDASVIIGIANHEHRTVEHTVELWIVNMTFVDDVTHIHQIYYFDSFTIALNHTDVDLESERQAQWESMYEFNVSVDGDYKLWFLLYQDGAPALPYAPTYMRDYAGTSAEERIPRAVENEVQSLYLNLRVTA